MTENTKEGLRIGVLFESDEWSDHKLCSEIKKVLAQSTEVAGKACLINMEDEDAYDQALRCDALVSRVFASAQFRGHQTSLERVAMLLEDAQKQGILVLNPPCAHSFEISKDASTKALARAGILVPKVYGCAHASELNPAVFHYPCIIKPDCGGRTTHTFLARSVEEASMWLADAPDIVFIVEEYLFPERGYITRVEIVGGEPTLVIKRSVTETGLSAYRLGSVYEMYDDCPEEILDMARQAAKTLGFVFGSFDIIERDEGAFFIDANSVSNVSEDCTELFGYDLMRAHADEIVRRL